jgi:hypothetical protein
MIAFAPRTDQNMPACLSREPITVFTSGFNDTGTDKQVLSKELGKEHALGVLIEVGRLYAEDFLDRRRKYNAARTCRTTTPIRKVTSER